MKTLNISDLKQALISASNNLFNNKERIDALNIFPVPDGDTGSNMSLTFQKAIDSIISRDFNKVNDFMQEFSKNMLFSARGNSGVILSQIFKGFSNAWSNNTSSLLPEDIIRGFESASKSAYNSVLKPVEGTILTVIRETFESLSKLNLSNNKSTITKIFETAVSSARKSLSNTPNLLPVLKEVGVVDSGGEGLVVILEGILSYLKGKFIEIDLESTKPFSVVNNSEIYSGEFGYCTELIIKIKDVKKFSKNDSIKWLEKKGNSIVAVVDKNILKIHIHTIKPGDILNFGQKIGEFLTIKIENMTEQANNTKSNVEGIKNYENKKVQPNKKNAIISCNSGSGFIEIMNNLECDYVIEGGQSNNPSTNDIIEAIDIVNAKNIIILPNNSNIILAAQQAAKIKSDRNIYIVPTKSQVEGISAIMNYSSDLDPEDNLEQIEESLKSLVVGEVVQASKDTKINNVKVKNGSYLMIMQNKIISTKKDSISASKSLVDKMISSKKRYELLVIYYGNNTSLDMAKEIEKYILNKYDIEVQIQFGNQSIYDFLFGLE